jgi:hypothetical protein
LESSVIPFIIDIVIIEVAKAPVTELPLASQAIAIESELN